MTTPSWPWVPVVVASRPFGLGATASAGTWASGTGTGTAAGAGTGFAGSTALGGGPTSSIGGGGGRTSTRMRASSACVATEWPTQRLSVHASAKARMPSRSPNSNARTRGGRAERWSSEARWGLHSVARAAAMTDLLPTRSACRWFAKGHGGQRITTSIRPSARRRPALSVELEQVALGDLGEPLAHVLDRVVVAQTVELGQRARLGLRDDHDVRVASRVECSDHAVHQLRSFELDLLRPIDRQRVGLSRLDPPPRTVGQNRVALPEAQSHLGPLLELGEEAARVGIRADSARAGEDAVQSHREAGR